MPIWTWPQVEAQGETPVIIIIIIIIKIIIIIIEGLSLLQSIPPTTADKQTQAQKRRVIIKRRSGITSHGHKAGTRSHLLGQVVGVHLIVQF